MKITIINNIDDCKWYDNSNNLVGKGRRIILMGKKRGYCQISFLKAMIHILFNSKWEHKLKIPLFIYKHIKGKIFRY